VWSIATTTYPWAGEVLRLERVDERGDAVAGREEHDGVAAVRRRDAGPSMSRDAGQNRRGHADLAREEHRQRLRKVEHRSALAAGRGVEDVHDQFPWAPRPRERIRARAVDEPDLDAPDRTRTRRRGQGHPRAGAPFRPRATAEHRKGGSEKRKTNPFRQLASLPAAAECSLYGRRKSALSILAS
jgi:hypothetical protein